MAKAAKAKKANNTGNSLRDKLRKNSTIDTTSILSESKFFEKKDMIQTSIPAINIAFAGDLAGGFGPGVTTFAGPSKHFKTLFSLVCAKAYLDKYPEAVLLFYDSEFGTPGSYFDTLGIDRERVIHSPITDVEDLKFDFVQQLAGITSGDKLIVVIDSIGNLASKKEVEDATNAKSVADMSRAKAFKSLFRIITPHLVMKDIPLIVVNHTYKTMEMYAKDVVGGGTGNYYASDNIFIIGREQEKDNDKNLVGYNFKLKVEKSRYVKERSIIPITVTFDQGILPWSGLFDMALESGHIVKTKPGSYVKVDQETGEYGEEIKEKDMQNTEFWISILECAKFATWVRDTYRLAETKLMVTAADEVEDEAA
jgi:RecA/RadA recombinase